MNDIRAVAWDIDGTLVDSEPLHHRALLAGSRSLGVDLEDLAEEQFRGIHMADVWTALRPRMPAALLETAWLDAIATHYIANRVLLKPLPGAIETVGELAARGIPQGCVSNSHRRIVDANLEALGIARCMAFAISFDDVSAGKPDPEPYRRAASLFCLEPASVLAVEDSRAGLQSAMTAGMPVALCAPVGYDQAPNVFRISRLGEILSFVAKSARPGKP